jgi:hypothetical protein
MSSPSRIEALLGSNRLRSWAIRILIILVVFELFYVVAANYLIRSDVLIGLINKKPEKTHISWETASTWLPGVVSVKGFVLRSQTRKDQIYLTVAEADARISLHKLAFKTIHIRGVDAQEVDFRYRERLDKPPKEGQAEKPDGPPPNVEYWPEIPGYSNPPDPRPEDLYPMKKKKRPWIIKITGAEVEGPVTVALNESRLQGDGSVGGGVTVKPRETIKIHRGRLALDAVAVTYGPEVVTENLIIHSDLRFKAFPAKGAEIADVIGGITGELSLEGELGERAAVHHEITPGLTTFGAGAIDADLRFKDGVLRKDSSLSLESDAFHLAIMGLVATGSATVSSTTSKEDGQHLTDLEIVFGEFEFADPEDDAPGVTGKDMKVQAQWNNLSLAGGVPASRIEVDLPDTRIHDVGTFGALIPDQSTLTLQSGTGDLTAHLEVNQDRMAVGRVDLVAEDIIMASGDEPIHGDLELHGVLTEGDLESRRFDLSGTTIRFDNMVGEDISERKQKKLDAWFCDLRLERGEVTFGRPMTSNGRVHLTMHDTRPVVAVMKRLGVRLKGLSLMPNIKDIHGVMSVDFGQGHFEIEDLGLTGKGLEVLGWIHSRDKKIDGRLFIDYGILTAGVGLNQGKAKVHLGKPRKWFEENSAPP